MKKIAVILLVLCVICSSSGMTFATNASDIENHWAKRVIQDWTNNGLVSGYSDGTFKPDKAITRAEFMVLVNKVFQFQTKGIINFTDVDETDWYYDTVRIASSANYIAGYPDGSMKPNYPISRQEVAAILSKVTNTSENLNPINSFVDSNSIATWAKGFIGAVVSEGYMGGYPSGAFKPTINITRAEALVALNKVYMDKIAKEVAYKEAGTFGPKQGQKTITKDVIVKADNVTLQNTVIKGNLTISEEVGDGNVALNNVTVEGKTVIRGGGKNSIHINGGKYNEITIEKTPSGSLRIVASNVEGLKVIISKAALEETIILEGSFNRVTLESDNATVITQGKTQINEFVVEEGVKEAFITLDKNSVISQLTANAKTVIQGQGIIKEATGEKVSISIFEKAPEKIITPSHRSNGSNKINLSSVSITGGAIVNTTLTAILSPAAATVSFQWKSSPDGHTYTDISGSTSSTYTPANDDVGKYIKVQVTGTGSYYGTIASEAVGPVIPTHAQTVTATASALNAAAGKNTNVTLEVRDSLGGIDTSYSGERTVTVSGTAQSPLGSYGSFHGEALTADSITGQDFNLNFTSGVAIVSLSLHKASTQTLEFSIAGVTSPATNPIIFTPVPASAAGIYLTADIAAPETSGGLFALQPILILKDSYGNLCVNDNNTTVTAARKDAGAWTLTGTKTVTASNGTVSFTDLGAENIIEISDVQVLFTSGSLPAVLSSTVNLPYYALTATAAAFSSTPTTGNSNPVTLTVKDALGNIATRYNGQRTVTISGIAPSPSGSYGTFNGTELTADSVTGQGIAVTFTSGVAIANLSLSKAATQTIQFSIADVAAPAVNPIIITSVPGSAAGLYLTTNIVAPTLNGGVFGQQPIMTLKDSYGNPCTNDSHTAVTASKKDSGVWTLTGTKTATASNGIISFTDLGATNATQISGAQIAFTASGLPETLSASVTLPFYAQMATASVSTSIPVIEEANPVTLTVKDALGNLDTTFNGTKSVTISGVDPTLMGSYGTFNGIVLNSSSKTGQNINVTFTNGVAVADLYLYKAAAQTIAFRVAGVAIPGTNSVSITPVVADVVAEGKIGITDPGLQASGLPFNLGLILYDKYGNTVKDGTCTVTVSSDIDGILANEKTVTLALGDGTGTVGITPVTGGIQTLTVTASSVQFTPAAPGTVQIPIWNDASGWFILGDASGGGGGGGASGNSGARGGNGGGNDDIIIGTDGSDIIFGDGSGGGGGLQGSGYNLSSGAAGAGGSGKDMIYGGHGNDIIFGDGFNGASGWNSNNGGFGGGGGGGGGGNLAGNTGGQGGLGAGSGRGYSGDGSILFSGFGNVGNSAATAIGKIGYSGGNGANWDRGYAGGGGFGGSNGGSGGTYYYSSAAQGQDGNKDPHAYKFIDSAIYNYVYVRLGNILASYPNYGAGNDRIDGGNGSDNLFGLGGNDTFEFKLDNSYGNEDIDTIWDFNVKGTDSLRLFNNEVEITPEAYASIIAAQTADDKDRSIVFSNESGKAVTIIVKNLNRDLTAEDFGL